MSGGQKSGGNCIGENFIGAIVRGAVAQEELFKDSCPGGKSLGDNCPGRNFMGCKRPGDGCPGRNVQIQKKDYFVSYINMTQSSLFFHIWTFFPGQLISKYLVIFSEVLHTVYFYLTLVFLNELKPSPKIKAAEFPNPCILFWSKHFVFPIIRTEYENFCAAECYFLTSDWFYASDKTPQSDIFQVVKKN